MARFGDYRKRVKRTLRLGTPEEKRGMGLEKIERKTAGYLKDEKIPSYQIEMVESMMKQRGLTLEQAAEVLKTARGVAREEVLSDVHAHPERYREELGGKDKKQLEADERRIIETEIDDILLKKSYRTPEKKRFKLWRKR